MYPLVLILLGIWTLVIIGGFFRSTLRKGISQKLDSPPKSAEVVISGWRRAAERGHALLEEQIDCDNFIEEFT